MLKTLTGLLKNNKVQPLNTNSEIPAATPTATDTSYQDLERAKAFRAQAEMHTLGHNYPKAQEAWSEAGRHYQKVVNSSNTQAHPEAILGMIRTKIKQQQYTDARKLLNNNKALFNNLGSEEELATEQKERKLYAEYHHLDSLLLRYRQQYLESYNAHMKANKFAKALPAESALKKEIDMENQLQEKPDGFLVHIRAGGTALEYIETRYSNIEYKDDEIPVPEKSKYRILSIDGGGLRGILPALWLCEMEYQSQRPIYKLFDMIAGTSTGAIIAAGLLTERGEDGQIPSAKSVLDLYTKNGKQIFTTSITQNIPLVAPVSRIRGESKYTADGRSKTFQDNFGNTRLSEVKREILITAIGGEAESKLVLFTRKAAQDSAENDHLIRDALMATSAAPAIFPSHKFSDTPRYPHPFLDGGLLANHPGRESYTFARNELHVQGENILMLSLGTGIERIGALEAISLGNMPIAMKGILQMGQNATEKEMHNPDSFGGQSASNYTRWQFEHDNMGPWDEASDPNVNKLLGYAITYMEEVEIQHASPHRLENLIAKFTYEPTPSLTPDLVSAEAAAQENALYYSNPGQLEEEKKDDDEEDSADIEELRSLEDNFNTQASLLLIRFHPEEQAYEKARDQINLSKSQEKKMDCLTGIFSAKGVTLDDKALLKLTSLSNDITSKREDIISRSRSNMRGTPILPINPNSVSYASAKDLFKSGGTQASPSVNNQLMEKSESTSIPKC